MNEGIKILVTMNCPSCGGLVHSEEGESLVLCKFCDSVFALAGDEGSNKLMYKLTVKEDAAENSVRNWMKKGPKAQDLVEAAEFTEKYPLYLPYWRLVGRGKACVCGVRIDRDKDGNTTRTPVENLINEEYVYSSIACDVGDLGVNTIVIPKNAEAINCEEECEIATFGIGTSKDAAFKEGLDAIKIRTRNEGASGIDEISFAKSFFFPKGFTLVYYPFWIMRYKYQERDYFAIVDGITGNIVSGRAPGSIGSQSMAAGAGGAIAGGVLGLGLGFNIIIGGIFGLVIAFLVLGYFYNRFRYGDEVITGNLSGKGLKSGAVQSNVVKTDAKSYNY